MDDQTRFIGTGDIISHRLIPGFQMEVLDITACYGAPDDHHLAFKVIDPEGAEDWLCSRDVIKIRGCSDKS